MIENLPIEMLDAALLRAKPGDLVILKSKRRLSMEEVDRIRDGLGRSLPEGVKGIVVIDSDGGFSIETIDGYFRTDE